MRVLRALINTAMRVDETITSNPCTALRIPAPPKRQVDILDLATWWIETDKLSPIRRDLHRAMLLTGARRSSILSVKRADVDLERAVLTFRHMKIGGPMMLPMGRQLTEMLKTRLAVDAVLGSEWLWPSPTSACGHAVEPKEMRRADLPSSHEYRHLARTLFHRERRSVCGKRPAPWSETSGRFRRLHPSGASYRTFATLHAGA
jgi:integrase